MTPPPFRALPLLLAALLSGAALAAPPPPPGACSAPPDRAGLEAAFGAAVARLEGAARRLYGHRYADAEIDVQLQLPPEPEPDVRLEARVRAAATDVASGARVHGEGTVRADLAWRDCRWILEGIDVDY